MKYVAAYCLLALGGKTDISENDLKTYLKSLDCEVNEAEVKVTCDALKGKKLHELCSLGMGKLGSLSSGGNTVAPTQGSKTAPGPVKAEPAKKEEKKKEPVVEVEENIDFGGLFG